jgi:hypothetical protein
MVFGKLFGKGPLSEKKIAKISKLASNPFAQPDVRMREMEKLIADGSAAALDGVLKRFAVNASGSIADEDEKKWLEDVLVDIGERALEPLQRYISSEKNLTYALRAYRGIAGDEEAVRFFLEVLRRYGPDDYRSDEAKLQLIWSLADDLDDERVTVTLVDFVLDHSDDVRWAVMDLIEQADDSKRLAAGARTRACELMATAISEDESSPRIQRRVAELLAKREWQVPGDFDALLPSLDEVYFLDKKRFVRRRARTR